MNYRIVYAEDEEDEFYTSARDQLEHEVKKLIANGWKPLGGVSVSRSDTKAFKNIVFAQAMIKE